MAWMVKEVCSILGAGVFTGETPFAERRSAEKSKLDGAKMAELTKTEALINQKSSRNLQAAVMRRTLSGEERLVIV